MSLTNFSEGQFVFLQMTKSESKDHCVTQLEQVVCLSISTSCVCVCAEITDRLNLRTGNEGWERNTENEIKRKRPRKQISSAVRVAQKPNFTPH